MTPEAFCYWLQGYAEMGGEQPTQEQWETIKDHLKLVFTKVTPDRQLPAPFVPQPLDLTPKKWEIHPDRHDQWPFGPTIIC